MYIVGQRTYESNRCTRKFYRISHFSFRYVNWVQPKRRKKWDRRLKRMRTIKRVTKAKYANKNYKQLELTPVQLLLYGFLVFWKDSISFFDGQDRKKKKKMCREKTIFTFLSWSKSVFFFSLHKTNALTIFQRFASNTDQSGTCAFLLLTMGTYCVYVSKTFS